MLKSADGDKDLILLNEIDTRQDISQRELSQKTGLSLGSVNLLLKRMIRQGFVKMETIPANRVIYMLTPVGIAEKAVKTVRYIRSHYHMIQSTKANILQRLDEYHRHYAVLYVCRPGSELDDLMQTAVSEYLSRYPDRIVQFLSCSQAADIVQPADGKSAVILYLPGETEDAGGERPESATGILWASLLEEPADLS